MPDMLNAALAEFYEEQVYRGNSPATVSYYRTNVGHHLKDAKVATLDGFTTASVRSWLVGHAHLNRSSLRTYDRSLRVVGNWLHRRGYLASNPLADLPKPKAPQPIIGTLAGSDIAAMLAEARRRRDPLRDVALLTLLIDAAHVVWLEVLDIADDGTPHRRPRASRVCRTPLRLRGDEVPCPAAYLDFYSNALVRST